MRSWYGWAAVAGLAALLAACELTLEHEPRLALVCQTQHCKCVAATAHVLAKRATADVLWRRNGDAYCPEGFVLRLEGQQ